MSAVAVVGYAYDVNGFYRVGLYNAMSLQTAFGLLFLAICLIISDLNSGITNLAVSDSAGGVVIRRLLPTLPFTLFLIGLGTSMGRQAGAFDANSQFALMVVLSIGVSIIGVATTASKLRSVDDKRKRAEADLLLLNQQLEFRVQERTEELEKSLREVKHLSGLLPICAWCKKIRDDNDYWQTVEQFMTANSDAKFTHSICPECRDRISEQK